MITRCEMNSSLAAILGGFFMESAGTPLRALRSRRDKTPKVTCGTCRPSEYTR